MTSSHVPLDKTLLRPSLDNLPKPRLNPFAFPTDTDFRLLLLVAMIISSGLFIYNWIYLGLPQAQSDISIYSRCQHLAQIAYPSDSLASSEFFERCRAPVEHVKALWMLGGVSSVLVLAVALYLIGPPIKLRRQGLVPIASDDAPEAVIELRGLCVKAGLRSEPRFVWNPLNGSPVGLAFGRRGRYYVALGGGLMVRSYVDPRGFDAVVLHELAHLANRDVDKTYLAMSLWQAFVVLALVPLLVSIVLQPTLGSKFAVAGLLIWRVAAIALIVYLVRNAVLRSRETYADLRAALWEGSSEALSRVLGSVPDLPNTGIHRLLAYWRVHPSRAARQRALSDTRPLFRLGFWDALGTGLAAGIAYPSLVTLILLVFTGVQSNLWSLTTGELAGFVTSIALGLLIAGVVGVGVWRATFAELVGGKRAISVAALAGGLAIGLGLGDWIGFEGGFNAVPSNPGYGLLFGAVYVLLLGLLALGLFGLLEWFAKSSGRWLWRALERGSAPNPLPIVLTIGLVLSLWLGATLQARNLFEIGASLGVSPVLYPVLAGVPLVQAVFGPLGLVTLACLWAYPLAAELGRTSVKGFPAWAFLDQPADLNLIAAPTHMRVARLASIAVGAAAAYVVVITALRLFLRMIEVAPQMTDLEVVLLFLTQVGLAAIVQGCAATVTAARAYHHPVAEAILVAFWAGVLMAVEEFVLNVAFGGHADPRAVWPIFSLTVISGGILAITLASLTARFTRRPPGP